MLLAWHCANVDPANELTRHYITRWKPQLTSHAVGISSASRVLHTQLLESLTGPVDSVEEYFQTQSRANRRVIFGPYRKFKQYANISVFSISSLLKRIETACQHSNKAHPCQSAVPHRGKESNAMGERWSSSSLTAWSYFNWFGARFPHCVFHNFRSHLWLDWNDRDQLTVDMDQAG